MGIRRNSRLRAKQLGVYEDILAGYTYAAAARKWNYSDESGARAAFKAERARHEQSAADKRSEVAARLESLIDAFAEDALTGDGEKARTYLAAMRDLSRLLGLNAPVNVAVGGGISAAEFGEQFTALFEAAPGTMRWLAPRLPEELLGQVPEETRAQLFPAAEEPAPEKDTCPGTNGWANITDQDIGGSYRPHRAAPFGLGPDHDDDRNNENEGCAPFCGPMTAEWVQPPSGEGVRPPAGDTAAGVTDSGDPDDDGGRVETVEAELIPLPPAQRRVKAPVDGNGVPYDRGGIHRRLPGPSSRYYNPLGYSGWTQIIRPADD